MQLIAIILLPLTIILVVITFGSITLHQQAMRSMVGERDARLVSTAARSLGAQVDLRLKELTGLGLLFTQDDSQSGLITLSNTNYLSSDFDLGLAVFDEQGNLLANTGDTQVWQAWLADSAIWQAIFSQIVSDPGKLFVVQSPIDEGYIGLLSVEGKGNRTIVGAFSISKMVEDTLVDILPPGNELSVLLVDPAGQVLYKAGDTTDYSFDHPGITEALQGESGTFYVKVKGDEHVTAYAPVTSAGWALVTEESWEAVSTPTLRTTQVAPLVLVPALLIMLLAIWLGTRQIIQPLRILESRAASLASGDFMTIQEPVGGIAEIQQLQNTLIEMAHKVQEAQRSLHAYIGSITSAQEEERQRLARELHDDTLQALIALKQRLQLAELELHSSGVSDAAELAQIQEIASFTEQTIDNLRRLTRALRPIYLEDLGLVPALEMLARETGQAMGIPVEFHHQGVEQRLDPAIELALYRMAQEALSNTARHAQATQASLSIAYASGSLTLQVVDNGVGFNVPKDPTEFAPSGHYGLLGIKERAELIGATLQIQSSPLKGTHLSVTLSV
jgi:two-component system sensor histidine kinase UhpB